MSAFTPLQQVVLMELARFAGSQIEDLRKTLAETSTRVLAMERLLLGRGIATSEDVTRPIPSSSPTSSFDLSEERAKALSQVLRRILAGDGGEN
jgi:hypothetical protein